MDKIAVISDIHGNLPALEAVLEDIAARGVGTIYCLGDLIGKGPSGDKVIDLVRRHCTVVIRGNWDDGVARESDSPVLRWHRSVIGEERLDWLRSLPFMIEFVLSGRFVRLFHASPRSEYERIQPWDAAERRLSLFEPSSHCARPVRADMAGYGDIHNAYVQHLDGRILFNAGSVGNPLDLPAASYALLEGEIGRETPAPWSIQLVRVPYDIERAIREAREADMPDLAEYERELRTARYRHAKED
ncbi:MAG: serine/threonine protein phosphatase [Thermobacillus sp. ZCTH02-B1]|uniref:metallophosphoesterase family protein n=1 Tax=Thermobacillus sp. ZCTH02-B1 TaxID=1858795 RepID=UPI000B5554F9|nr:metallophosphoesterase family protein [Thermobacillus sp. ZCTH02-B1]OUM96575.1 MAG: serine/threonine protein phosphatase [Thermobacillus sp. ZCTH02-B1]